MIVYECKDTLRWSNAWLEQARREGGTHGTPYLVIVTWAFPRGEKTLCVKDDIIVVDPMRLIHLAQVIRRWVVEVHRMKRSAEGQAEKEAELFEYLSGTEFRDAFDSLTVSSTTLGRLLSTERTWHERDLGKGTRRRLSGHREEDSQHRHAHPDDHRAGLLLRMRRGRTHEDA